MSTRYFSCSPYGTAVFVHGCFWHRHKNCRNSVLPKTQQEFWLTKLNGNVERDRRNAIALKQQGWKVITLWECEIEAASTGQNSYFVQLHKLNASRNSIRVQLNPIYVT